MQISTLCAHLTITDIVSICTTYFYACQIKQNNDACQVWHRVHMHSWGSHAALGLALWHHSDHMQINGNVTQESNILELKKIGVC